MSYHSTKYSVNSQHIYCYTPEQFLFRNNNSNNNIQFIFNTPIANRDALFGRDLGHEYESRCKRQGNNNNYIMMSLSSILNRNDICNDDDRNWMKSHGIVLDDTYNDGFNQITIFGNENCQEPQNQEKYGDFVHSLCCKELGLDKSSDPSKINSLMKQNFSMLKLDIGLFYY